MMLPHAFVQLLLVRPGSGGRALGPGNLATGLASHHLDPLPLVRLSLDPTLQSPARSRPHFAHTRPLSASNGSFRSRLDRTLRCPIVRPHPFPSLFSHLPAPSSQLRAPAQPKSLLAGAGKLEPRCQTRLLIRPPRTHPMPKADTSLLGAIGRITGNTGGFSGTKLWLCLSVCVCVRGSRSKLCLYSWLRSTSTCSASPVRSGTVQHPVSYSSVPTLCSRTPSWHKYPRVVCLYLPHLISLDLDRYEVPASSFPPSLSHSIASALLHSSISLPRALPLSPLSLLPTPFGAAEKNRNENPPAQSSLPQDKPRRVPANAAEPVSVGIEAAFCLFVLFALLCFAVCCWSRPSPCPSRSSPQVQDRFVFPRRPSS